MKTLSRLYAITILAFGITLHSCQPAYAADTKIKSCVAVKATEPKLPEGIQRAWGESNKFWPQRSTIRVKFLSGTSRQKTEAWKRMQIVDSLTNLMFVQVLNGASEIRVRFDQGKGHWSMLGTDCRTVGQSAQTMNLELTAGVFGDGSAEWDRVAIHETLHAIGLDHEHQSPLATSLVWNRAAVYDYYGRTQGWSKQQIDFQVINRYSGQYFRGTAFDQNSIMEYPVPPGLANIVIGWNSKLTDSDIRFIKSIYP